jgi:hypothetical protein
VLPRRGTKAYAKAILELRRANGAAARAALAAKRKAGTAKPRTNNHDKILAQKARARNATKGNGVAMDGVHQVMSIDMIPDKMPAILRERPHKAAKTVAHIAPGALPTEERQARMVIAYKILQLILD